MKLSKNFYLKELTFSQTAERSGLDNNPSEAEIENLRLLCERVLQPVRDHFQQVVSISSGFRNLILNRKLNSKDNSDHVKAFAADYKPGDHNSGWIHVSYSPEISENKKEYLMAIKVDGKTQYKQINLSTDRYVK